MSSVRKESITPGDAIDETNITWSCNSNVAHKFLKRWNTEQVFNSQGERWLTQDDIQKLNDGECPMCPDVSAVNDEDSETASKGLPIGKIAVIVVALVCVALLVRACF